MRYNGKEAMGLMLSPETGTNVIDTGKQIEEKLQEIKSNLPKGIEIEKIYYQPELVTTAIGQFVSNLIASVVVVVGVLLFTMGMRSGLIIGSGLILSILGTLIYMLAVKTDMEKGEDRYTSLTKTAKKTAIPLLGATVIAVMAFLPMYLMPTDAGEYISSLFWIGSFIYNGNEKGTYHWKWTYPFNFRYSNIYVSRSDGYAKRFSRFIYNCNGNAS